MDAFMSHDGSLKAWEDVLQKHNNLTNLRIQFSLNEDYDEPLESPMAEEVQAWVYSHHVQQFTHFKALEYSGEFFMQDWSPTIYEYLLDKFPNLESIKLCGQYYVDPKDKDFNPLVTAIKIVQKYQIVYSVPPTKILGTEVDVGKAMDGNCNRMTTVCSGFVSVPVFMKVDKQQHSTSIGITLPSITNNQAHSLLKIKGALRSSWLKIDFRKLSGVARGTYQGDMPFQIVAMMEDPYYMKTKPHNKNNNQDSNDITQKLVQALTAIQNLQIMEIWVYQLSSEMTKRLPVHDELTHLEIVDALTESDAFFTFSVCFLALEYLTLSSCLFANGDAANGKNSAWINLEQQFLKTLTLMDDKNSSRSKTNSQDKLYAPTLFHLKLASQKTGMYLTLLPLHIMLLTINKEQFKIWPKEPYAIISISCASVDTIIIRLGHASHAIDIKKYL